MCNFLVVLFPLCLGIGQEVERVLPDSEDAVLNSSLVPLKVELGRLGGIITFIFGGGDAKFIGEKAFLGEKSGIKLEPVFRVSCSWK